MKKLLIFLVLLFPIIGYSQSPSKVVTGKLDSGILGLEKKFSVYLPAGYDDNEKFYPVLYLLHGASDTHEAWLVKGNMKNIADRLISEGTVLPMIIVMPDASGDGENNLGWNMGYFNRPGWDYEDFFFKELLPFAEKEYRIMSAKNKRAVAGLSMGGGGSIVYALHHPEMFSSACPLSGLLGDAKETYISRREEKFKVSILQNDPQKIIKNAGEEELESFRKVRWYIDCGDDDYLAESSIEMFLLMKEKNIPLQYRMRDGGHTWEYWQSSLPSVLQFISIGFSE